MPSENQEPRRDPELKRKAWLAVFCGFCVVLGSGSACYLALVGLSEHYVGTRARGRAPRFNLVTMITPRIRPFFRSVPQHWTLTPQQRAFIDAFADEVSQK
ncbi:Uncharacterised protein [Salmonella enterica subsp. enterica serovar Heidelberg]|nr:Uncharacterised protein [Salmonella enterica subsp. enterica serovar Heidelberg]